jgi:hypothetical protein
MVRLFRKLVHIDWTEFETQSQVFFLRLCVIFKIKYNSQ